MRGDLAKRVASRMRRKAHEPDEWYPTMQQDMEMRNEEEAAEEESKEKSRAMTTALEDKIDWDYFEENFPELYAKLDAIYQEVSK